MLRGRQGLVEDPAPLPPTSRRAVSISFVPAGIRSCAAEEAMGVRREAAAAAGTGEVDGSKEVVVTATPAAVGAATAVAVVVAEHFGCSLRAISSWAWQSLADAQWSTSQSCWHLRFSLSPPPRGLP